MSLNLEREVSDLFRQKVAEFLEWMQANWQISEKDLTEDWLADKTADYREGNNAAIEGFPAAFECWNEEFGA